MNADKQEKISLFLGKENKRRLFTIVVKIVRLDFFNILKFIFFQPLFEGQNLIKCLFFDYDSARRNLLIFEIEHRFNIFFKELISCCT